MKIHSAILAVCAMCFAPAQLAAEELPSERRAPSATVASPLADPHPHVARVDIFRGRLEASGTGMAPKRFTAPDAIERAACLAAEIDARRKLVELAHGFGLESETVIESYRPQSDTMHALSAGLLATLSRDEQVMLEQRTCSVRVSVDIPDSMRHQLPLGIEPLEPSREMRAPIMQRPD